MIKKDLFLLLTAFIWGFDFVAQHVAMDTIGPLAFCFLRFVMASICLLIVIRIRNTKDDDKSYIKAGLIGGCILFFGSVTQQIGLVYTLPGKSGFISALYIVFVPLLSVFVKKDAKKPSLKVWLCVAVALLGLYLLTFKSSETIVYTDFITVLSAFVYAIHILIIDKYAPNCDPYKFNCVQFIVCAVLSLAGSLIMKEPFSIEAVKNSFWPLLYVGIIGTCVSYTTQTLGQIDNDPTVASLIMSLESVFAALAGYLILHNVFSNKELMGCALIFGAIIFIQIPDKKKKAK